MRGLFIFLATTFLLSSIFFANAADFITLIGELEGFIEELSRRLAKGESLDYDVEEVKRVFRKDKQIAKMVNDAVATGGKFETDQLNWARYQQARELMRILVKNYPVIKPPQPIPKVSKPIIIKFPTNRICPKPGGGGGGGGGTGNLCALVAVDFAIGKLPKWKEDLRNKLKEFRNEIDFYQEYIEIYKKYKRPDNPLIYGDLGGDPNFTKEVRDLIAKYKSRGLDIPLIFLFWNIEQIKTHIDFLIKSRQQALDWIKEIDDVLQTSNLFDDSALFCKLAEDIYLFLKYGSIPLSSIGK